MFTGLIEQLGTVRGLRQGAGSAKLAVEVGTVASELALGDSVSVNGVCLTVVEASRGQAVFDVVPETLERSALATLSAGSQVNIERSMRADGRFGGHFVQGHVDGIGRISKIDRNAGALEIEISAPPEVMELVAPKGSIAVDGISLTVARRMSDCFTIAVIPHTLENTTLGRAKPGTEVNLETDILGKYVQGLLKGYTQQDEGGVTQDMLRDAGFI